MKYIKYMHENILCQTWWHVYFIPVLRRKRLTDFCEFKTSQVSVLKNELSKGKYEGACCIAISFKVTHSTLWEKLLKIKDAPNGDSLRLKK